MTNVDSDTDSRETRDRIEVALFHLGYRNQLPGAVISTAVLMLLVFGYGSGLARPLLWWWFSWMLVVEAIGVINRWHAWRSTKRGAPEAQVARNWRRIYLWQLIIGGIGWGNLGLFYTDAFAQNAVLLVVFFGVASLGSNLSAAHHYKAMALATPPAILFQISYVPNGFGAGAAALQAMLFVYLLLLIYAGRNIHRNILENIRLRFDNEAIIHAKAAEALRADKANLDKSKFLAAASHDLRQPVHALLLLVAAMKQRCVDASQLELIDHIQQAGFAIVKLFNALMELSRLESGAEVPEPHPVALTELLAQIIARNLPEADQKGLRLQLVIARSATQLQILTDRVLFGRILDNLIGNAVRYTNRGRVLVTLRAHSEQCAWLDVWDTGIGIDDDDLIRIFEPYVQIGNAERDRTKGLGLGLAIVRQTSLLLGCPIEVKSRKGKGSRFRLSIGPLRTADFEARSSLPEKVPQVPALGGKRVLVIDDDLMVQHAMSVILESWHAEVRIAGNPGEVARTIDASGWIPDCILCDYRLPGGINGIDLLNQLTERFPTSLGILQTGELDPAIHEKAEDEGFILLKKPVAAELLAATLSSCMQAEPPPAHSDAVVAAGQIQCAF